MALGWAGDFLNPGYYLYSSDMQVIQDAISERTLVWDGSLPLAPGQYPGDKIDPAAPDRSDIQSWVWWQSMQLALSAMLQDGASMSLFSTPPHYGVVKKDFDLEGLAATTVRGADLVNACYVDVIGARVDAGLTDYAAQPAADANYAFRVRKPREVNATGQAIDNDNNPAALGHRAWLTTTGMLHRYNGAAWVYCGQGGREMPDILDSELAAPFYVAPRAHLAGDYIGGYLLHEMRALAKLIYRFTRPMDPANTLVKSGNFNPAADNNVWATVKSDVEASFAASTVDPATTDNSSFLTSVNGSPIGPTYAASMSSHASEYTADVPQPSARNVKVYVGAGVDPRLGGTAAFNNQGMAYVDSQYHLWNSFLDAAVPVAFSTGYIFSNPPNQSAWPFGGAAPPLDDTTYYASMYLYGVAFVADYTPGFAYT